ncbi:MAG: hypothetical protein CMO80_20440 [Verrucomicrobiales bacterium]|nr:hypothetical protein [Verrucomicrobiales bacterium]
MPKSTIQRAVRYLEICRIPEGGIRYSYSSGGSARLAQGQPGRPGLREAPGALGHRSPWRSVAHPGFQGACRFERSSGGCLGRRPGARYSGPSPSPGLELHDRG